MRWALWVLALGATPGAHAQTLSPTPRWGVAEAAAATAQRPTPTMKFLDRVSAAYKFDGFTGFSSTRSSNRISTLHVSADFTESMKYTSGLDLIFERISGHPVVVGPTVGMVTPAATPTTGTSLTWRYDNVAVPTTAAYPSHAVWQVRMGDRNSSSNNADNAQNMVPLSAAIIRIVAPVIAVPYVSDIRGVQKDTATTLITGGLASRIGGTYNGAIPITITVNFPEDMVTGSAPNLDIATTGGSVAADFINSSGTALVGVIAPSSVTSRVVTYSFRIVGTRTNALYQFRLLDDAFKAATSYASSKQTSYLNVRVLRRPAPNNAVTSGQTMGQRLSSTGNSPSFLNTATGPIYAAVVGLPYLQPIYSSAILRTSEDADTTYRNWRVVSAAFTPAVDLSVTNGYLSSAVIAGTVSYQPTSQITGGCYIDSSTYEVSAAVHTAVYVTLEDDAGWTLSDSVMCVRIYDAPTTSTKPTLTIVVASGVSPYQEAGSGATPASVFSISQTSFSVPVSGEYIATRVIVELQSPDSDLVNEKLVIDPTCTTYTSATYTTDSRGRNSITWSVAASTAILAASEVTSVVNCVLYQNTLNLLTPGTRTVRVYVVGTVDLPSTGTNPDYTGAIIGSGAISFTVTAVNQAPVMALTMSANSLKFPHVDAAASPRPWLANNNEDYILPFNDENAAGGASISITSTNDDSYYLGATAQINPSGGASWSACNPAIDYLELPADYRAYSGAAYFTAKYNAATCRLFLTAVSKSTLGRLPDKADMEEAIKAIKYKNKQALTNPTNYDTCTTALNCARQITLTVTDAGGDSGVTATSASVSVVISITPKVFPTVGGVAATIPRWVPRTMYKPRRFYSIDGSSLYKSIALEADYSIAAPGASAIRDYNYWVRKYVFPVRRLLTSSWSAFIVLPSIFTADGRNGTWGLGSIYLPHVTTLPASGTGFDTSITCTAPSGSVGNNVAPTTGNSGISVYQRKQDGVTGQLLSTQPSLPSLMLYTDNQLQVQLGEYYCDINYLNSATMRFYFDVQSRQCSLTLIRTRTYSDLTSAAASLGDKVYGYPDDYECAVGQTEPLTASGSDYVFGQYDQWAADATLSASLVVPATKNRQLAKGTMKVTFTGATLTTVSFKVISKTEASQITALAPSVVGTVDTYGLPIYAFSLTGTTLTATQIVVRLHVGDIRPGRRMTLLVAEAVAPYDRTTGWNQLDLDADRDGFMGLQTNILQITYVRDSVRGLLTATITKTSGTIQLQNLVLVPHLERFACRTHAISTRTLYTVDDTDYTNGYECSVEPFISLSLSGGVYSLGAYSTFLSASAFSASALPLDQYNMRDFAKGLMQLTPVVSSGTLSSIKLEHPSTTEVSTILASGKSTVGTIDTNGMPIYMLYINNDAIALSSLQVCLLAGNTAASRQVVILAATALDNTDRSKGWNTLSYGQNTATNVLQIAYTSPSSIEGRVCVTITKSSGSFYAQHLVLVPAVVRIPSGGISSI